ncbi:MAG: hypothetical protein WD426_08230 [Anditalea sp.]
MQTVYPWITNGDKKEDVLRMQLIIREDIDGTVKYFFCNMHGETLERIVQRQRQRVGKSGCDYGVLFIPPEKVPQADSGKPGKKIKNLTK